MLPSSVPRSRALPWALQPKSSSSSARHPTALLQTLPAGVGLGAARGTRGAGFAQSARQGRDRGAEPRPRGRDKSQNVCAQRPPTDSRKLLAGGTHPGGGGGRDKSRAGAVRRCALSVLVAAGLRARGCRSRGRADVAAILRQPGREKERGGRSTERDGTRLLAAGL